MTPPLPPRPHHGALPIDGRVSLAPIVDPDAVRVTIDPGSANPTPATLTEIDETWSRMKSAMPRLYDGPILAVSSIDTATAGITARRSSYKPLAVQGAGDQGPRTGVQQLSVTGIVAARDASGRWHLLLARRSHATRIYGGMWELGPSGGIDPPAHDVQELTAPDCARQLAREAGEELAGLEADWLAAIPVAITRDFIAHSDDVCMLVRLPGPINAGASPVRPGGWEYTEARWLPIDHAAGFARRRSGVIIPPTRLLLDWLPGLPGLAR